MRGFGSLLRSGALGTIAAFLVVALTVPAAAAGQTCDDANMLAEVEILSVNPLESTFTWEAFDLLSYGDGEAGTFSVGQLEVRFEDINTRFNITHYEVIATPSDEPGTSEELGVEEKVTSVNRPSEVGSTVTATLELEPGTNYAIEVVAYYFSVQVSPNQSKQDSLAATTFLSPPFLGGGTVANSDLNTKASPSDYGVNYLVYKADGELHTLRWLGAETYGPFDHIWLVNYDTKANTKGADILCSNEDGDLEDDCTSKDVVGLTDYRVEVHDEDGTREFRQLVPIVPDTKVYSAEFNLNDGTYTFSVQAGVSSDGTFYALSDKAQVVFDIPDDYRRYNQTMTELDALVDEIVETVGMEEDDFDAFYDSDWNFAGLNETKIVVAAVNPSDAAQVTAARALDEQRALSVYLNNLYN